MPVSSALRRLSISPPPELKETKGREGRHDLAEFAVHGALALARNKVVELR